MRTLVVFLLVIIFGIADQSIQTDQKSCSNCTEYKQNNIQLTTMQQSLEKIQKGTQNFIKEADIIEIEKVVEDKDLNKDKDLKKENIKLLNEAKEKQKQRILSFFQQDTIVDEKEVLAMIKLAKRKDPKFDGFDQLIVKNKLWAYQTIQNDPQYFSRHVNIQKPKYLWIGCSDSRVPANTVVGLKSGQIFVHRNVANLAPPSDVNAMAVIQFAISVLKVEHIIVAGHYGCGGIKAALTNLDHGPLEGWLSHIRQLRVKYSHALKNLSQEEKQRKLVQLNVQEQVYNIGIMPIVQTAWQNGQKLTIHGVVYDITNGLLNDLQVQVGCYTDLPLDQRIFI